jgi:hypothetical protein
MLYQDIHQSRGRDDSIRVSPASGLRVMNCPRAGKGHLYRVAADNHPLFLDLDNMILSDSPLPSSPAMVWRSEKASLRPIADTLELVMGDSSEGFFPSDLDGAHPRVFLRVPTIGKLDSAQTVATLAHEGEILLSRAGRTEWSQVRIHTDDYLRRRENARAFEQAPWFLLTVPVDILTSPFQLMAWYVFRNGAPIGCTGGCH